MSDAVISLKLLLPIVLALLASYLLATWLLGSLGLADLGFVAVLAFLGLMVCGGLSGLAEDWRFRRRYPVGADQRVRLRSVELAADPELAWDVFLRHTSFADDSASTELQRHAADACYYWCVMGGNDFEWLLLEWEPDRLRDVAASLRSIGAEAHAELLERASASQSRLQDEGADAVLTELTELDAEYHALVPSIDDSLRELLVKRRDEFFDVVDD